MEDKIGTRKRGNVGRAGEKRILELGWENASIVCWYFIWGLSCLAAVLPNNTLTVCGDLPGTTSVEIASV